MPKEKSVSFYMEKELQKYISPEAKNEFFSGYYETPSGIYSIIEVYIRL